MPRASTSSDRQDTATRRYVGSAVGRVEDAPLLLGVGRFVDDIDLPGQAHARIVRSRVARGRIASVQGESARRRRDVLAVITAEDIPTATRIPLRLAPNETANLALQPPLARDVVRYVGEPIAVVVAESAYAAEDAAEEIWAEIEPDAPVVDPLTAVASGTPAVHDLVPGNVVDTVHATAGEDSEACFARADVVVRERVAVQRHTAIPLEPRGLVAAPGDAGSVVVWGPTKVKHFNRKVLAELLDVPLERVRFIEPDVGGGFGIRGEFYPEDFLIPWLALAMRRPVKWVEDRAEHFVAANHSREQQCEIEVAATADGELLALRAKVLVDIGAYVRTNGLVPVLNVVTHLAGPYRWRAFDATAVAVLTNKTPAATYRGPGQYEAALHRERVLDLLARRAGIDPAELRRRNLVPGSDMPYAPGFEGLASEVVYAGGDFPLQWTRLCEHAGYAELRAEVSRKRRAGRRTGIGTAAYVEAEGRGPYEWARVIPESDGTFTVRVGVASVGQGIATTLAQLAADALNVSLERIAVTYHDTDAIPEGGGAFASRSLLFGGNAVVGAARDLLENAKLRGAELLGVTPDQVQAGDGLVRVTARPERAVQIADCGCEGSYRYEKHGRGFSMGAALAVVELDATTGAVNVTKCVVCADAGRAINPQIVDGQLAGAAVQGIGGALLELLAYGDDGQPLVTSFMDYAMPTSAELPSIDVVVLELTGSHEEPANPLGVKGVGEAGIVGVGACVANAVADALDGEVVIAELPISPETVLAAIRAAGRR